MAQRTCDKCKCIDDVSENLIIKQREKKYPNIDKYEVLEKKCERYPSCSSCSAYYMRKVQVLSDEYLESEEPEYYGITKYAIEEEPGCHYAYNLDSYGGKKVGHKTEKRLVSSIPIESSFFDDVYWVCPICKTEHFLYSKTNGNS